MDGGWELGITAVGAQVTDRQRAQVQVKIALASRITNEYYAL